MSFEALLSRLDADPRVRGRQWEALCAWYLENSPEYRALVRRAWRWEEWPHCWGPDAGIDLVVETLDGEAWALQAKAYGESYHVKKADLDSFLAESSRPWGDGQQFAYRLVIATTDHVGATARRTLAALGVGAILRSQLELAEVTWPTRLDELRPAPASGTTPRAHQEEASRPSSSGSSRRAGGS